MAGEDGAREVVGEESAASIWARCRRAAKTYEARVLACYQAGDAEAVEKALGRIEEESDDAEAGALLEAETAIEIHGLHTIAEQWREANRE